MSVPVPRPLLRGWAAAAQMAIILIVKRHSAVSQSRIAVPFAAGTQGSPPGLRPRMNTALGAEPIVDGDPASERRTEKSHRATTHGAAGVAVGKGPFAGLMAMEILCDHVAPRLGSRGSRVSVMPGPNKKR